MNLIRSLLGRRQFILALTASAISIAFARVIKAFDLILKTSAAMASAVPRNTGKSPLRAIVVYYSATGATGQIAGAIYRGMRSVMECDVAPLKKMDPKDFSKYDVVAIGGPIWYYRETANLRLYVYKMPNMAGKLCIPFCSHGGSPSGFFYSLNQALRKKEFTIIGWGDWYGDATHVLHMPQPYTTHGHPDKIDIGEAEAFGREMAERAVRIYAGERNLIPEIPDGPNAEPLWVKNYGDSGGGMSGGGGATARAAATARTSDSAGGQGAGGSAPGAIAVAGAVAGRAASPAGGSAGAAAIEGMGEFGSTSSGAGRGGGGTGGTGAAGEIPHIDTTKCVYPRCTACVDNCVVGAIDLSMLSPANRVSGSDMFVKGCIHCGMPLCERACAYDAITYKQSKTKHVYDMKKCTYPKCTLCIDNCPMDSIDFSQSQPVVHNNCEGCDLCWCICPYDAISIPNLNETHARMPGLGTRSIPFLAQLQQAIAKGKFRPLISFDDLGWDHIVYKNPNAPRVVLREENYPYDVKG